MRFLDTIFYRFRIFFRDPPYIPPRKMEIKKDQAKRLILKYRLPKIVGVSAKQIAYATDLRDEWLSTRYAEKKLERLAELSIKMHTDDFVRYLKELAECDFGGRAYEALEYLLDRAYVLDAYKLSRENRAGEIISLLRDRNY